MSALLELAIDKLRQKVDDNCVTGNIGTSERILSVVAGGLICTLGIKRILKHPLTALSGVALGAGLVYRGITGQCKVKAALADMANDKKEITVIEHRYLVN